MYNLCRCCLNRGHKAKRCNLYIKCQRKNCGKRDDHNSVLHSPPASSKNTASGSKVNDSTSRKDFSAKLVEVNTHKLSSRSIDLLISSRAYLGIVPVKVKGNDHVVCTYAFWDAGSDATFCEQSLAKKLDLKSSLSAKFAVQTLSSGNPYVLDTVAVSFSVCSVNDARRYSEVVVIDNIPAAPSVAPSAVSIQKHSHLCNVFLTVIERGICYSTDRK